uniref:RNA helicase n=1 Tax=Callorhinchus milii TaxID=7868 RepID=A0A4W3HJ40_CALMI
PRFPPRPPPSPPSPTLSSDLQELLQEFPQPKNLLARVVQRALKRPDVKDHIVYQSSDGALKKTTLQIHWPKTIQVEGYGSKKIDAERHAAANACKLLKEWGLLGPHNQLFPTQDYEELVERLDQTGGAGWRELNEEGEKAEGTMDCTNFVSAAQNSPRAGHREVLDTGAARALTQFPQPKYLLSKVIQIATSSATVTDCVRYITDGGSVKTCRLELQWPSPMSFSASGRRKSDAERRAAALACQRLKELGFLDKRNRPLTHATYNQTAVKALSMKERRPTKLHIPSGLRQRIQEYLLQYPVSEAAHRDSLDIDADLGLGYDTVVDAITGREYTALGEAEAERLSEQLRGMWERSRPELSQLPVDSQREALLSVIEENRVVVVSGATGCGKTTRIPQFILEHYVTGGRGAVCNVVVTQPRRLSAVSVAQRVREELGSGLGRRVGYQVRLESRLPPSGGALLFCTVGVLLRKLQGNARLEGLSHVLVDEVHECDVNTDFLLVLLRQALTVNPRLHLVLMSATGDTQRLARYFGDCPIVHVPGFLHPVTEHYLEDILPAIGGSKGTREDPTPDLELVTDTILHIDASGEPGGILCFLPGWQEIRGVQHQLEERLSNPKSCIILPGEPHSPPHIHAHHTPHTQRTHIHHTHCTVNSLYSIFCEVSCLDTVWVSRANVWQRRGRAGRCQPGHVYHLFPRARLQAMEEFQTPEILRSPLDSVLLQAKLHAPDMTVGDFLSKAMNSPEPAAVSEAVRNLQEIGVLDEQEGLTVLGQRLAHISSEPRLAKAIVLACVFRCLSPVLAIVACLTREPFLNSLLNRTEVEVGVLWAGTGWE